MTPAPRRSRPPAAGRLPLPFPAFFLAFRLVFIPASVLTHSGHDQVWLTAISACAASLGAEWLVRRAGRGRLLWDRRGGVAVVIMALVTLGFFPEEGPVGLVLWMGIGGAWGAATRGAALFSMPAAATVGAVAAGALLGATGSLGPGSWLAAAVLGIGVWLGRGSPISPRPLAPGL